MTGPRRPSDPGPSVRPRIGIVGTFDVANFGDLLFPELAQAELSLRLGDVDLRRYSPRAMASPPWFYAVRPLDELLATIGEHDLIVVGGGHLVRFDHRVAPGYEGTSPHVANPTGYWLSPTLAAASAGVPVAWNALGVSPDTPSWARSLVAIALGAIDYASVRDPASLAELASIAPDVAVHLVPDSAFAARTITEAPGGPPSPRVTDGHESRPYVIVQAAAGLRPLAPRLARAVAAAREAGRDVYEVAISPVLGDRTGAAASLDGAIALDPWPHPVALARLIAGAETVIAESFHLTVVALAHGVPVLRAPARSGTKYVHLEHLRGVEVIEEATDLGNRLATGSRSPLSTGLLEQAAQVAGHWDRVAALVGARDASVAPRRARAAATTLAALPGVLEGAVDADAAARERLEAEVGRLAETLDRAVAAQAASVAEGERAAEAVSSELARSAAAAADATHLAAGLADRVTRLEVDLATERMQGSADRQRAAQELRTARAKEQAAKAQADQLRRDASAFRRLRSRLPVRVAARGVRIVRRARRALLPGGTPRGAPVAKVTIASEAAARTLARRIAERAPGSARVTGPHVSIIVLNRNGAAHLGRLLPALEATTYRSHDVIVVDNGSADSSLADLEAAKGRLPLGVIQNAENRSFSEANNQAAMAATGELLLFLNNDIEPLGPGWLGRLVDTLEREQATAVGARLVYPRRAEAQNEGDRRFPDLTLQHRGIHFVAADGIPSARNLGTGADPDTGEARRVGRAAAVTAACLLVRREAFDRVGGFTAGYVYGTEDVDLNLKLAADGGRIVYDGLAALWHHEYGTQNAQGRDWKRQNRARNRQQFVDRWGPQVFREVFQDRLRGTGAWSEEPLHVAVTLTRDDPGAGWGDYYTAHEIGDALEALGWRVTYAERHGDHWYDLPAGVDVVVSLLDAYDPRRIPRGIVTVAWVRNWTDRWIERPWFDEYDIVLASSERSRELINARSAHVAGLMLLATNPARFTPAPTSVTPDTDVLFVGNRWGEGRSVEETLPPLADAATIRVFGRGWDGTTLAAFDGGPLAYDRLPAAYATARLVLDDTASPTLPYGAVNARVFDALAAGALVVTDNEIGVREVFGDAFPVARDADQLAEVLAWTRREPAAAAALQARLREAVLERHTYAHRAEEIRGHLLDWAGADRYAILVGIPSWDVAPSWGDYHYARALQRELERRGHPTRVHLLDEWNRSPSARADVVIHLHGLSDHRPRPAQVNILWVISHPDRVTSAVCERYDLVFVASDSFARQLASVARVEVRPLHQATDPERFRPDSGGPAHELLFVGNTRGVRRQIVDDLTPTVHDLAIYGRGWSDGQIDPRYVRGEYLPNHELGRYYSSAAIVLNDHWPDMRSHGLLSNRLYDALAAGAFVISDAAAGIEEEFDGGVVTYTTREDLRRKIDAYLADPEARRTVAERGHAAVMARHTFANRVDEIVLAVEALNAARPGSVRDWDVMTAWLTRRSRARAKATAAVASRVEELAGDSGPGRDQAGTPPPPGGSAAARAQGRIDVSAGNSDNSTRN